MPVLLKVLTVVFPVFCVIGSGYLFAGFKRISLEPVIEILLYLTIPALVISSLSRKRLVVDELTLVAGGAVLVVLGTGLITFLFLAAIKKPLLRGFYLPTMFMNSGNMALPLALLAFGEDGLTVAVLYYIAISLMVYSIGVYIAKGRSGGLTEIFKLPLIYASVIGITINLSGVRMPHFLLSAFDMLGAATIPLMQVSLGYRLHSVRLSHTSLSVAGSIIRIGGGVLMAWIVVTVLGIGGLTGKIIILSSSMPSAVINFVMSHRYGVDSDLVASTVAMSTLLSIVTTPLVVLWIM